MFYISSITILLQNVKKLLLQFVRGKKKPLKSSNSVFSNGQREDYLFENFSDNR